MPCLINVIVIGWCSVYSSLSHFVVPPSDPVDLQGDVQSLNLTAQSQMGSVVVHPAVGTSNFTLGDLTPNTDYTLRLAVTIFGGASITSEPVTVSTLDGGMTGD